MIHKAKIADAEQIRSLILYWAKQNKLLDRSLNYIYENIRDFWVYRQNNKVIACCALSIVGWQNLAEIKSLAVNDKYRNQKIGTKLIACCLKEAKELGVKEVFTLTFVPEFFKKNGFKKIKREKLPHKIWSDCINCTSFPNCNEIALITKLIRR